MPSVGESTAELADVDESSLSSKGTPQAQQAAKHHAHHNCGDTTDHPQHEYIVDMVCISYA